MDTLTASGSPGQDQAITMTLGSPTSNSSPIPTIGVQLAPPTPPDQASIQSCMDKNKETLKRKLMLRRSVNELVDQGIYPPLKTPPAFAEKTKQLERAKTGDLLRHKIQQRPNRQLLVQQHILEDTTIDPSLHERQRLLKRSRLLDGLNGKLAHRPGPLELVQGNILQSSNELANAIKDGTIHFVPTCDTEDMDQSGSTLTYDDESAGSDGTPSPSMDESSSLSDVSSPSSAPPITSVESLPVSFTFTKNTIVPLISNNGIQIPSLTSNSAVIATSSSIPKSSSSNQLGTGIGTPAFSNNTTGSGKSRSKKPKPKIISKGRIIKFHEYKGPPSVVKTQPSNTVANSGLAEETPYHFMLQQQQLFLQWQLEFQQSQQQGSSLCPSAVGSAGPENVTGSSSAVGSFVIASTADATTSLSQGDRNGSTCLLQAVSPQQTQSLSFHTVPHTAFSPESISNIKIAAPQTSQVPPPPPPPPPPSRPTQPVVPRQSAKALTSIPASALSLPKLSRNLEEMKVADLKAELKKRSLPVSGPKPQLIERLKPFTESSFNTPASFISVPKPDQSKLSTVTQLSQTFQIKTEHEDLTPSPVAQLSSSATATSISTSASMPMPYPISSQGIKTVVSVKPMVKEEPMTTTDITPPVSPLVLQATNSGAVTAFNPGYETPNLVPKLIPQTSSFSLGQFKQTNLAANQHIPSGNPLTIGQTVVTMSTDTSRPSSVVPAEMMPMEVDSVSIDLNQGVDDMAFKAASLGQSLDSKSFKTLVQPPICSTGYKTACIDSDIDSNIVKTSNVAPGFDGVATIRTVNISPNTNPATVKTINLGSSADGLPFKTLNLGPNSDDAFVGFKGISVSPVKDTAALLKTIKGPAAQLSPTHMSPVQITSPLAPMLTSPTSLLQLQQLQTLQQLQQQLLQQTQAHQFQQQSSPTAAVQLTTNDHVVLAQAKQIEELQRQLQESHLKLKLQQLQQQQQQQQQQLWQIHVPTDFAQLSQEQLTVIPQNGQVVPSALQLQQHPNQVVLQPAVSVMQQQQPTAVFLNSHTARQSPLVVSGVQKTQIQPQHPTSLGVGSQNVVCSTTSGTGEALTSNSNLMNMVGGTAAQLAGSTSGDAVSVTLPYAIHINLTDSGNVELPAQLQPLMTPASASMTTKASALQLPAQLLLTQASANILAAQTVKTEAGAPQAMGPHANTTLLKPQVTTSSSVMLIPGHTNGVVSRTSSLPPSSVVTSQQKLTVDRCSSNPFFGGPLKEPPRYDEAIKTKQQQSIPPMLRSESSKIPPSHNTCLKPLRLDHVDPDIKSQTMDDVLEILIRNGDLPPSAATRALSAPKMSEQMVIPANSVITTTPTSLLVTPSVSTVFVTLQNQPIPSPPSVKASVSSLSNYHQPCGSTSSPRDQTLTSMFSPETLLNVPCSSSPHNLNTSGSSSLSLSEGPTLPDGAELLGWGEPLPSPELCNMDWSVESGFGHLDLADSNLNLDTKTCDNLHFHSSPGQSSSEVRFGNDLNQDIFSMAKGSASDIHNNNITLHTDNTHESLSTFDLAVDSTEAVDQANSMDMSEWLDVLIPNSNLNLDCMNTPTRLPFSADVNLTPGTQQEVFDIFNFDDSDFGSSVMNWDKLTEQDTGS